MNTAENVARFPQKPPRPKLKLNRAWSHEDDLKALVGRRIIVDLLGHEDATVRGKLLASDKFTLKVENDRGTALVVFKHAIESFYEEKP